MGTNEKVNCEKWDSLFNGWASIAEPPVSANAAPTDLDAARFLLYMGFDDCVPEVLFALARMLSESVCVGKYRIKDVSLDIAGSADRADALSKNIVYYIGKNYDRVRETAEKRYGAALPEINDGIKTFVNRMSIIYSVYYLPEINAKTK